MVPVLKLYMNCIFQHTSIQILFDKASCWHPITFAFFQHFQLIFFKGLTPKYNLMDIYIAGMSDPNKRYDRRNGNSCTVKITFFLYWSNYLTVFGQTFPSNLFYQSFTDEKGGKVKNR